MKKYLFTLITLLLCFIVSGCDNGTTTPPDDEPTTYYDVTYYVANKIYLKETYPKNSKINQPKSPELDDMVFVEWQINGERYNFNDPLVSDIDLYAHFTEIDNSFELLDDTSFSNGFGLRGVSTTMGSEVFRHLTTDNVDAEYNWDMAQWWTKYDFQYADYEKVNGVHIYSNESRTIKVDTSNKSLYMKLLASKEYDSPRVEGQNWPHLLIEQTSSKAFPVASANQVIVSIDFTIYSCENMMSKKDYSENLHAAQFLWYFTLTNILPEGYEGTDLGKNGDFFWFGIPLFDSRYPNGVGSYKHVDSGFVGATNKLIYSISNKTYLDNPIEYGKTYHIEVDILPYLKEAFIYGVTNGALSNCQWANMYIGYMNLGWELPGTFDVESEIKNISCKVIK